MTRVALVHDWLTGMRGGERALEVMCELDPDADVFTLVYVPGTASPTIVAHRIRTTPLSFVPGIRHLYRHCLPLFPAAVELFDLDAADLVISTSHCAAKAAVARPGARHLCYCFTPMRYAWDQFDQYFGPGANRGARRQRPCDRCCDALARWDAANIGSREPLCGYFPLCCRQNSADTIIGRPPSCTLRWTLRSSRPASRQSEGYALDSVCTRAVQANRRGHRCRPTGGSASENHRPGSRARPTRSARAGRGGRISRLSERRGGARRLSQRRASSCCPARKTSASSPSRPRPAGGRWWRSRPGGARETVLDRITGVLVADDVAESLAEGLAAAQRLPFDPAIARAHAESFSRQKFATAIEPSHRRNRRCTRGDALVKRHNRLLVALYVCSDAVLGIAAFVLAYVVRFESGLIPDHEGLSAVQPVHQRAAVHRRAGALRVPRAGALSPAARPLARRRLLRRLRRQHPRRRLRHHRHAVLPGVLRPRRAEGSRRLRGVADRLGAVPRRSTSS